MLQQLATLNAQDVTFKGRTFSSSATAAPAVALASQAWLWNDGGSGKRIWLTAYKAESLAATFLFFGSGVVPPASLVPFAKSLYAGNQPASTCARAGFDRTRGLFGSMFFLWDQLNNPSPVLEWTFLPAPIIIDPGRGFGVQPEAVNQDVSCAFMWYETAPAI